METTFGYSFPAIRGIQAKKEYFVSMCPLRLIPKIFSFDEEDLSPEIRAQRNLNRARVLPIARYILGNLNDYVFSAITASIDSKVNFEPFNSKGHGKQIGVLHIPMAAKFVINDGQHRRAAIEHALKERIELGDETIAVVFFLDPNLQRCQQMFADLNRHAVRPSKSLGLLYDHRESYAKLSKLLALRAECFKGMVEFERTALSPRSSRLFTLSALYQATRVLLEGRKTNDFEENLNTAIDFWETIATVIKEWGFVKEKKITAGEVRRDYIHTHGIVLQALGKVGNSLLNGKMNWKARLGELKKIDWSRENTGLWEGRAMIGGKVSKAVNNVILTTAAIKAHLKIDLTPEEERVNKAYLKGKAK